METTTAPLRRADLPEVEEYAKGVTEMAGDWAEAEAAGDGLMRAASRVRSLAEVMS